jgi:hypothetical protein
MHNKQNFMKSKYLYTAIAGMIIAALIPVIIAPVFADSSSGQQGIDKARENANPKSCRGLNIAATNVGSEVRPCPGP